MSTPRVNANVTSTWSSVEGSAASVAKVTWLNTGNLRLYLAFTAVAPVASDPVIVLNPGEAWFDETGSAKAWAKTDFSTTTLTAHSG